MQQNAKKLPDRPTAIRGLKHTRDIRPLIMKQSSTFFGLSILFYIIHRANVKANSR